MFAIVAALIFPLLFGQTDESGALWITIATPPVVADGLICEVTAFNPDDHTHSIWIARRSGRVEIRFDVKPGEWLQTTIRERATVAAPSSLRIWALLSTGCDD